MPTYSPADTLFPSTLDVYHRCGVCGSAGKVWDPQDLQGMKLQACLTAEVMQSGVNPALLRVCWCPAGEATAPEWSPQHVGAVKKIQAYSCVWSWTQTVAKRS